MKALTVQSNKQLKKILRQSDVEVVFLDDRFFNQKYLTEEEKFLRQEGVAYYFNKKNDLFYDQFEIFKNNQRWVFSNPYPIEPKKIKVQAFLFHTFPFVSKALCRNLLMGDFLFFAHQLKEEIKQAEMMTCLK